MKKNIEFEVEYVKLLNAEVFELKLSSKEKLPEIGAGQFLMLDTPDKSQILKRPFVIYKWDEKSVTLGIALVGKGTKELFQLKKGDKLSAFLPLGNGWSHALKPHHKKIALVGSGIGGVAIRPILQECPDKEYHAFWGFKSKDCIMFEKEFKKSNLKISTVDGSAGFKGYVNEMFDEALNSGFKPDVILVCGSHVTCQKIKEAAIKHDIECYMSGEERMACGIGACLVCVCKVDVNGKEQNLRVCFDGPVFDIRKVTL
ncbi:MAG: hypothetical protein FWE22_05780 [Firmicutes bacterium]|nr:hypothetical protein [Bacillota bacterium]